MGIAGRRIVHHETAADEAYQDDMDTEAEMIEYANQLKKRENAQGAQGLTSRGGQQLPDDEPMDEESTMDPFLIAQTEQRKGGAFENPFLQSQRPQFRLSKSPSSKKSDTATKQPAIQKQ